MSSRIPMRWSLLLHGRWARLFLGAMAAMLVSVNIYAATMMFRQQQLMQDISRYTITWLVSQAAYEVSRLQMAIGAEAAGVPGANRDEVLLRLDIVLSRVQLFKESEELATFLASRAELQEIGQQFQDVMKTAQLLIDEPGPENLARRLLTLLAPLNPRLTQLNAVAHDRSEELMANYLVLLYRLYWIVSGILILLIGSSLGLVGILGWNNRLLTLAHHNVKKLVTDLQSSGVALANAAQEAQAQNAVLQERDRRLHRQNTRFDAALNNMSQALVMVDVEQKIIVCNVRYGSLFGLEAAAMRPGTRIADCILAVEAAGRYETAMIEAVWSQQLALLEQQQIGFFFREDAKGRALSVSHQPMADGGWVATYEDISERRSAEAQISFLAHHDSLTNLPNRRTFYSRLKEELNKPRRPDFGLAVHCIDLDFFKHVNDTLGHPAGDAVLGEVGRRLQRCAAEADLVARLGGDEFAILQLAVTADQAEALAIRVLEAIRAPYDFGGRRAVVGASIGIALATDASIDAEQVFGNADLALYQSKADGRNILRFFEPGMEAKQKSRYSTELELRDALARQEFVLHYQPIYNLEHDRISGYEALLRWQHPTRGLVLPGQFIMVAEATGLIAEIGEWVLRQACMDAAGWPMPVKIAVNLSPVQFRNDDLVPIISSALKAAGLTPTRLELEVTESVLLHNNEHVLSILHRLRSRGIKIALDDFGTGYSSLSYLRSFPFDKIKVDQSFIRDMNTRLDCLAIVESISGLACRLGMTTTAEGVETHEQLRLLRSSGFTEVQGYLLGRPEPNSTVHLKPAAQQTWIAAE